MAEYYLIGSLRNPDIPKIAKEFRDSGVSIFDDWYAAGPIADDSWRDYETGKGLSYQEALKGYAAKHVFSFDYHHLNRVDGAILTLPAGKSGHLELGYMAGLGKPTFILLDETPSLPKAWDWISGIYEGEGSITRNGRRNGHGMQLTVTMKDKDIIDRLHQLSGVGTQEGPYTRSNSNWSPMYRWSVRRREDILYTLKGMWEHLGTRRKDQATRVLTEAGVNPALLDETKGPYEFRFDVMYQFATAVCTSVQEVLEKMKTEEKRLDFVEHSFNYHNGSSPVHTNIT